MISFFECSGGDSVMSKGSKASAEKTDVAKSLSYNSAPWKVWVESYSFCHLQHFFTQTLLFCLQKSSLINHTFCLQHKASKSEEYVPIVYPEVILCVEIYEQRQGSVKVIS